MYLNWSLSHAQHEIVIERNYLYNAQEIDENGIYFTKETGSLWNMSTVLQKQVLFAEEDTAMKVLKVLIPATEQVGSHTVYYIEVFIREYSWLVARRYREFYDLHEKLVKSHGIDHSLIPPKKYFGFLQPEYVERRRQALEAYFETLLSTFEENLPKELLEFLEMDKFDVCGVTHTLAKELFITGDAILAKEEQFILTPLQLHCITSRLGMAAPTCDSHVPHGEIGNLYDFLYQLKHLKASGNKKLVELSDNMTLKCNLGLFKSLKTLEIDSCEVEPFEGLCFIQSQIEKLTVHHSIHLLKDILVDDEIWEQGVLETVEVDGSSSLTSTSDFRAWTALNDADFSRNDLPYIDESVVLLPNVTCLNLSCNQIDAIEHLQALSNLVELDLSYNKIASLGNNLNTRLGNIKKLNLAGNELDNVEGLDKMYSLTDLNLSENYFTDVGTVLTLGELPCLEMLDFRDNAMTREPLYRVRVFTAFDDRAEQLELDGQHPTSREMTKIRELLQEEQNFEIINYPTPPQYSVSKRGNKKGRSIDRVIALDSETETQSSTPITESKSSVDESDAEFRSRVEKIRQIGGDAWLTLYDEVHSEEEMTQLQQNGEISSTGERSPSEPVGDQQSPKHETISGTFESPDRTTERTAGARRENETHPSRLQFGFAPELEKLVHDKVESSADLTSGTYMVEVEGEAHNEGSTEERMVGVDLSKGVILEIQITTGKTFAKHNLEDISSVDILELHDAFCVDIRDIFSKEWRRHFADDSDNCVHNRDYRQVARYRMRSMEDAAELFALLYKFITERSSKDAIPNVLTQEPLAEIFPANIIEWPNPLGVHQDLLHKYFDDFLQEPDKKQSVNYTEANSLDTHRIQRVQSIYQTLHAEFIDVGCLRHDRSGPSPEMARLILWSGCLPYVYPDHELPICLLMTNVNIYLFHSSHLESPERIHTLASYSDLRDVLHCFYSFPVRELNEVVFGLYDQGFRLEVKLDGPRGTFTVITRDAEKTDKFLGTLRDVLGEPLNEEHSDVPPFRRQFSSESLPKLTFPTEDKIDKLKLELAKFGKASSSENQHLLMYSIVREIPDCATLNVQENVDLTKMLRSLIVTNSEIYLCDEDHVHWPLPSFVRAPPSTPQWVVTKAQWISKIVGLEVFELKGNVCEFFGEFGLSLIFDCDESAAQSTREQHSWHLIFRAADERTQLQRSLSQVWKDNFQADLKITHSKPKSFPVLPEKKDGKGLLEPTSPNGVQTPVGTPVESKFKKTHRRVGSDFLPIFKPNMLNSLESLVALDRKILDGFFHKWISQKEENESETLLHVLWTGCTPYLFPSLEFKVCILLSNLYLYILADKEHKISINKQKGIRLKISEDTDFSDVKPTICFNFIPITQLRQVCVGLFDQTLRIETESRKDTFTLVTRDFKLTSTFLERLGAILSSIHRGDSSPASRSDTMPTSIYDSQSTADNDPSDFPRADYQHTNGGVRFVYPSDDTLDILKDAIAEFSRQSVHCLELNHVVILVYLLVFHETETAREEPRTLVIMDKSLCLCIEDHVNYPLPLFATGLPENPQYNVQDLRDIQSLSRVEFSDFNSCDFTMVFSPTRPQDDDAPDGFDSASMGELCVITHHLPDPDERDIYWKIVAQTYEEKEKAMSLICKLWADIHGGALPVMKAKG